MSCACFGGLGAPPIMYSGKSALTDLGRLGAPCGDKAAGALDVALAVYATGDITAPQEMWQFAEVFELTPELRKSAAASLTKSKAKAPD